MRPVARLTRACAACLALGLTAAAQDTTRISVDDQGLPGVGDSRGPSISAGGRFVAFQSTAALVGTDTNGASDVFVRDRATGSVEVVSVTPTGETANGNSIEPTISADGRYVAFLSNADDLLPGHPSIVRDAFVYDREERELVLASVTETGATTTAVTWEPALSGDGRFLAFRTDAALVSADDNGVADVYVRDLRLLTIELVSVDMNGLPADGASFAPSLSFDGRYVAFESDATDLAPADSNGERDVFVRDRSAGTTGLASLASGNFLASGRSMAASISADGRYVAFASDAALTNQDTNGFRDVFVRDRQVGQTLLISRAGLFAPGNLPSDRPAISADGRYVAFESLASNLVPGDTNGALDVFRARVGALASRIRVSVATDGSQTTSGSSQDAAISGDGSQIAFWSDANDLVAGDVGFRDVFVRNEGPSFPELHCTGKTSSLGCTPYLSFAGTPSATSTAPFAVIGHDFRPDEAGILLYGTSGRSSLPFHGGRLCVKLPLLRWPTPKQPQTSGPAPCRGVLRRDFNARIQSGVDPALTPGQTVNAQWLQRDPADPLGFGDALSDGVEFVIGD